VQDDEDLYQPNEYYDSEEEDDEWDRQQRLNASDIDWGFDAQQSDDMAARLTQELELGASNDLYIYAGAEADAHGGSEVGTARRAGPRQRDGIDVAQDLINRRLFSADAASDTSSARHGHQQTGYTTSSNLNVSTDETMLAARQFRRQKDHFSLALEKPPLLSLSSFSCGTCSYAQADVCMYTCVWWWMCAAVLLSTAGLH